MEGNNLIGEFIGLFKYPVTTFQKRAEERNIKKEGIIALVTAVVIGLLTIFSLYLTATRTVNKVYSSYKKYSEKYSYLEITKEEYKEQKKEAKKSALKYIEFTKTFFTTAGVTLVGICLIAGMMYVISRLVKSPKDYLELLSMTNSAFIIYLAGFIVNLIFSFIYAPIGIILLVGSFIFALSSLTNSFRESMGLEDTNKLVICSTIVITVVFAILVLIASKYISSLFSLSSLL